MKRTTRINWATAGVTVVLLRYDCGSIILLLQGRNVNDVRARFERKEEESILIVVKKIQVKKILDSELAGFLRLIIVERGYISRVCHSLTMPTFGTGVVGTRGRERVPLVS